MAMRLLSFAIWAAVAASAVFWLTRLLARSDAAPAHTVIASANASVAAADFTRVLGSTRSAADSSARAEPAVDARFRLIGVVAPKSTTPDGGLALIAVDGKPPKPVGLGGVVDGSLVLLAVNHRRVELGPAGGAATLRLELPMVPEASRSVRAPGAGGLAAPPSPPPPLPALPLPQPQPAMPSSSPGPVPGRPLPAVAR
jgi:general secretion pathway protein C